jgi:hypothetical protein
MGHAEIIPLDDIRTNHHRRQLRQILHECFDRWLDTLESDLDDTAMTLSDLTTTIWQLRQALMGQLTQTVIQHLYAAEADSCQSLCPTCERSLKARRQSRRTVETLLGPVDFKRSYFYCTVCCKGFHPLDVSLEVVSGRDQLDIQQAIAKLCAEVPYDTAQALFEELRGISVSAERMHTLTNVLADGLSVMDVAPDSDEIRTQIRKLRAGKLRRPVMVLAIDGAHVPTRPDEAGELRDAPKRYRARRSRWKGGYKEAKGLRLYAFEEDRIVHVLSWHQIQNDEAIGEALDQIEQAGLIREDDVRLCVIGDGAPWIWNQIESRFPHARQVLDYYPCSERIHQVSVSLYGQGVKAQEWAEATLTRLYLGEAGHVIGGLKRMRVGSQEQSHEIVKLIDYLEEHRHRTTYGQLRRGGYAIGSGGIESANKFISHVRLKRSGAWWYVGNSNRMLALRCAKYNGTFERVIKHRREQLATV